MCHCKGGRDYCVLSFVSFPNDCKYHHHHYLMLLTFKHDSKNNLPCFSCNKTYQKLLCTSNISISTTANIKRPVRLTNKAPLVVILCPCNHLLRYYYFIYTYYCKRLFKVLFKPIYKTVSTYYCSACCRPSSLFLTPSVQHPGGLVQS